MPAPVSFTNKPVWSVLEEFLNPGANEMFTTLRVNPVGDVVPTLVVRQYPFTSDLIAGAERDFKVTSFKELPRWTIDPSLVRNFTVGRTRASAFNFVHIQPQSVPGGRITDATSSIVRNPPLRDEQSIKRNGIHPFNPTMPCGLKDALAGPKRWMQLTGDFLFGQELMLSGTFGLNSISSPITVGDNIEFDGTIYQIEGVLHTCSIDNGHRRSSTNLAVTHGVRAETSSINGVATHADETIYAALFTDDNTGYDPGFTAESDIQETE